MFSEFGKLIYVLEQAHFRRSLQKSRAEIVLCVKFLALRCDITLGMFFENVTKMPKDIKNLKKQRPDMKTTLSFLQSCKVAGNYFINLIFLPKWHFLCSAGQKTIIS